MLARVKPEDENGEFVLRGIVRDIGRINEDIARVEKSMQQTAGGSEDAKLTMSMSGPDAFGAPAGRPGDRLRWRFRSPKNLVSRAGPYPRASQPGGSTRRGGARKDSNSNMPTF